MRDTLPEAELVRREAVRRLDPRERLRQALEMSDALRRLMDLGQAARLNESLSDVSADHRTPTRGR
jgi:hypothetical protein